jgi:hypothetical protein
MKIIKKREKDQFFIFEVTSNRTPKIGSNEKYRGLYLTTKDMRRLFLLPLVGIVEKIGIDM